MSEKSYKFEQVIRKFSPKELYEKFLEHFVVSKWPSPDESWTRTMLNIFKAIGKEAGYEVRKQVMNTDLTWHVELPNANFLELVLEYEDEAADELVEEVQKKLIHIKSYLKCGVSYFDRKAEQLPDLLKRLESLVRATEIKDPGKWLLIFLKPVEEGNYNRVKIIGFEANAEDAGFREIGSQVLNVLRVEGASESDAK